MTLSDNKRVAVIGAGNWGANLVRNFCELLGTDRVLCCDASPVVRQSAASRYPGIGLSSDPNDLWEDDTVEAVVVATPPVSHHALGKSALEAGKHVLIEKPICSSYDQALELCELAEERALTLMVDHLLLYHPAVTELKARLAAGEFGEILYMYAQRLNLGVIRKDENVVWSLGPHDVAMVLDLLGEEPSQVTAQGGIYVQREKAIHDVALVEMHFPSGRLATLHVSWLDPHKVREITIVGDKKMVVFDDMEPQEKLRIYDKGASQVTDGANPQVRYGEVLIPNVPLVEPLRLMCQHFLDSIRTGATPLSDGKAGAKVVRVLEAAQQSLVQESRPVPVG